MKKIIKQLLNSISSVIIVSLLLSSCYKKFDPASYQPPFTINGYTSSAEIGQGHLVGYWAFDGSYIDSVSGTAGTGTGTSFTGGFKGQALQGALNSYVLASPSNAIRNMQSFTISEWVKTPPPSTGIIGIFTLSHPTLFWGNIEIFFENGSSNANGKLRVHIHHNGGDRTYAADGIVNLFDAWINLSVTYDQSNSTVKIFVNGTQVSSGTVSNLSGPLSFTNVGNIVFGTTQFQTTPSQTTGSGSQPWASFLTGQIDEVRVYNKALSATELQSLIVLQGKGK